MNCIDHPPLARMDGQAINLATLDAAVDAAIGRARENRGFRLFTLNLDHLVKRRDDSAFREAYERADFVTADGAPVAVLARRQGARIKRTTGADLVEPLCAAAAREGVAVALFGSNRQTLQTSAGRLKARHPRLQIVHCEAPPDGFDPTSPAAEDAARRIADSGARIVFVALGAPKQELFAAHMAEQAPGLGFVCIGAALDFIAGTQSRAPLVMRGIGLEWCWRLMTNPTRMARRYARCALMLRELLRQQPPGRPDIARA